MLIIKLIRFFVGYVTFAACGGFPERFVNLCTKNRIPLWNMKKEKDSITADTTVKGYKSIKSSAKNSGVRVKILKKHGLPFFIHKNRRRIGLLAGFMAAVITVSFLSTMIWSVSVSGNKTLSDEEVLAAFDSVGVRVGARRSAISPSDAAYEAKKLLPKIAWASVNIKGSRAEIVISELNEAPEFPDDTTPCNIIAAEEGTIMGIEATSGIAEVKKGDAVLKGDLLISGITENLDKTYNLKAARGKVHARVSKEITASYNGEPLLRQSELSQQKVLLVFGLKIPLGLGVGEENVYTEKSYASNGETSLPLGVITNRVYYSEASEVLPEEYQKVWSAHLFACSYIEIYRESEEILSSSFSFDTVNGTPVFTGNRECKKEIGKALEIFVEK